ncbi:esterase E4-like [Planococcus citri]|uniref:esterase E4-like n=1 Tax=Planococcus citri TaxID=170843 RepID=UPI0031F842CB
MISSRFTILLFINLLTFVSAVEEILLNTAQGKIQGGRYATKNNVFYYAFTNIPYAKPPIGELRFEPPEEAPAWKGVRMSTFPSVCYQSAISYGVSQYFGTEDCLHLNVYTPNPNERAKLPVLVCIHGGEFQRGSSYECPPNNFVEQELVFVSFNYRLGALGFLSTGDEILSGNNGLKDQVMALKWVKKYILSYGGDPNKITILGQNSGAVSVHLHMFSEQSKGLFQSAISQSGTALVPWAILPPDVAKNRTNTLINLIKCPNSSNVERIRCLKTKPAKILVENQSAFHVWNHEPSIVFFPTVELSGVKNAFLVKNPWIDEEVNTVPWILGYNSGEGILKAANFFEADKSSTSSLNENFNQVLPISLLYDLTATKEEISKITASLKNKYLENQDISNENIRQFINLLGDGLVKYGTIKAAKRYKDDKFFYIFDHQIKDSFSKIFHAASGLSDIKLPSHGDEFITLFTILWSDPAKLTANDELVAKRMLGYWINFIKTRNPNKEGNSIIWEPMTKHEFKYLNITSERDEMNTDVDFIEDTYKLWDNLQLKSREWEIEVIQSKNKVQIDEL